MWGGKRSRLVVWASSFHCLLLFSHVTLCIYAVKIATCVSCNWAWSCRSFAHRVLKDEVLCIGLSSAPLTSVWIACVSSECERNPSGLLYILSNKDIPETVVPTLFFFPAMFYKIILSHVSDCPVSVNVALPLPQNLSYHSLFQQCSFITSCELLLKCRLFHTCSE